MAGVPAGRRDGVSVRKLRGRRERARQSLWMLRDLNATRRRVDRDEENPGHLENKLMDLEEWDEEQWRRLRAREKNDR